MPMTDWPDVMLTIVPPPAATRWGMPYLQAQNTGPVTAALMTSASQTVTVTPSTATRLTVAAPVTTVAGAPASFTMTALDAYGNTATGYRGTIGWASSDPAAGLPGAYTFTAQDTGVHTFNGGVVLNTLGARSLTATDTGAGSVTGNASVTVNLAAPTNIEVCVS